MRTVSIAEHHRNIRAMRCVISDRPSVTLHHCHGGSMKRLGLLRGAGQKVSDYLVIPIHADFHVGNYGIDYGVGVLTWELQFGTQLSMLQEINRALEYDIFLLAGIELGEP